VTDAPPSVSGRWLPVALLVGAVAVWQGAYSLHRYPDSIFPSPQAVLLGFGQEIRSGRFAEDLVASLYRVAIGFLLAVVLGVPLGLWLGHHLRGRQARTGGGKTPGWGAALLPYVNFFRFLSPLAWIPFAIIWFGIGDSPAIFIIFQASFFLIVLATTAAVANIPAVYFQVARDYGLKGTELLTRVTLPAIMPQVITALRVAAGVAWLVVVAAEMIGVKEGLGFAIWDARNGLRNDLLVCAMISLGLIGIALDRLLLLLTRMPSVRWGYDR
jgi:NitT/TauT family transport system permease protein